jgi:hypothetical protein
LRHRAVTILSPTIEGVAPKFVFKKGTLMLKIMVRPRQAPCALLGIGTYYVSATHGTRLADYRWQMLELKHPLILDRDHVVELIHRHETNSRSPRYATDGAWALRREMIAQGHDGIVAVDGVGDERHLTIVHFDAGTAERPTARIIDFAARKPGAAKPGTRKSGPRIARAG